MKEKYEVVPMSKVPSPPVGARAGYVGEMYERIKELGTDQTQALRIPLANAKRMGYTRMALRKLADRDGRRLLTSRNQEGTVLWAWTIRKGTS